MALQLCASLGVDCCVYLVYQQMSIPAMFEGFVVSDLGFTRKTMSKAASICTQQQHRKRLSLKQVRMSG